ncbi:MAG: class I SAM-dependent methyltransferase [Flavobacterium sp.]
MIHSDVIGKAIHKYYQTKVPQIIYWETEISEPDEMDASYFFRDWEQLPEIEKTALNLCKGKVLEVGCAAGSHGLILQERGLEVTSIDISALSIEVCKARGLHDSQLISVWEMSGTFDTILLLMNGTGLLEDIDKSVSYLEKLKKLLKPNGQILIDSSDILYMYDQEEDGSIWSPSSYYGELNFTVTNSDGESQEFPWLYVDFSTLQPLCEEAGLLAEKIAEGEHHDYLARLTIANS